MLFPLCHLAEAQQAKKVPRIGYLSSVDPAREFTRSEAIRRALRDLGYIEGQNIVTEYGYSEGKRDRYPQLMAELVRLSVDIIVAAGGEPMIPAAKNATKTIPIVMVGLSADPVELGLIESLAHPGGNVTGLTTISRELGGKRLELLKEAAPRVARVVVLYAPTNPAGVLEVKNVLPVAARALGLTVQSWEIAARPLGVKVRRVKVSERNQFDNAFATITKQQVHAVIFIQGTGFFLPAGACRTGREVSFTEHVRDVAVDGGWLSDELRS